MSYMRYFIATCESVVDAFLIVRISVQFGDHFCTHAQRGQFWMVKKRQLKCPYGWRRGRLVCDLRMSGINDPALRTGRSGKSQVQPAVNHSTPAKVAPPEKSQRRGRSSGRAATKGGRERQI